MTGDAIKSFGIAEADLPIVAVHDTSYDQKVVMPKGRLEEQAIATFVRSFLRKRAQPNSARAAHEEL